MRKILLLQLVLLLGLFLPHLVQAQSIEVTPYGGYMLGGRINYYEGQFKVRDNAVYGIALDYEVGPGAQLELGYYRMDTEGDFNSYYPGRYPDALIPMAVNYFQVGALHSFSNGPITPYFVGTLGAAWYESKVSDYGDVWRFGVALGGGLKFYFGDRVGIRLQARMDLPLYFAGLGFFCGTGSGCGISANSFAPIVHGDFTGGLIIRLGE